MANVFSVRMWSVVNSGLNFPPLGPAVPAGFVWVVRDVRAVNQQSEGGILSPLILEVHGGATIFKTPVANTLSGLFYDWQGRAVVEAGEQLELSLPDTGWTVAVDGYQLTLP